ARLAVAVRKYLATRTVEDDLPKMFKGFLPLQFTVVLVGACLYVGLMELLGYYVASIVYMVLSMLFLRVKPLHIGLTVVILLALIYGVFSIFLKVPLPAGAIFG
ncbi:MAG: tripartite tricarboxylate transporter TctB family protein, partial [Duodenibacillus sp.]|nr:tripartite tricarboxylate transporter TctB family protein [Duodenibacillus sp.]